MYEDFTEEDYLVQWHLNLYEKENMNTKKIVGFKINQRTHI